MTNTENIKGGGGKSKILSTSLAIQTQQQQLLPRPHQRPPPAAVANSNPTISEHDVLLGRGGETNAHVGNRAYRRIVFEHQSEYLSARKKEKAVIAKRIVDIVKANGGRFLRKDAMHVWTDAGDAKAIAKTSQALREGLDVRNQRVREKKLFREDHARSLRVVAGKVAAAAASYEHDSHSLPDLRDEGQSRGATAPPEKGDFKRVCEV
jgi:hypothetical protein